jgi:hypothetical protein
MAQAFLRLAKPSARLDRLANIYTKSAPIASRPMPLERARKEVLGNGTSFPETGQTQCLSGPTSEFLQDLCTDRLGTLSIEKGLQRGARQSQNIKQANPITD